MASGSHAPFKSWRMFEDSEDEEIMAKISESAKKQAVAADSVAQIASAVLDQVSLLTRSRTLLFISI